MADRVPVIESVNPDRGAPGTFVTIRGRNFGESAEELQGVLFAYVTKSGVDLTNFATWVSPTMITLITNIKTNQPGKISIQNKFQRGESPEVFNAFMPTVGPTTEIGGWTKENFTIINEEKIEELENDDILGLTKADEPFPMESFSQFKNSSANIQSSNFSAAYFLIESFYDKKRDDFLEALSTLNRTKKVTDGHGFQNFLQSNIGQIFRSLDMFGTMLNMMVKHNTSRGVKTKLVEFIEVANQESDFLFESTVSKKDQIEKVRNSMQVFKEYKDLFTLPETIEKHFASGSFLDCATAFLAVKEKYPSAPFPAAKSSLNKSEKIISRITGSIESRMNQLPRPFDELKQMILFLNKIKGTNSAYLECVTNYKEYLITELTNEYKKFVKLENELELKSKNIPEYFELKKFLFNQTLHAIPKNTQSYNQELIKCGVPPNIEMISAICTKISEHFSQFWKLCSYCLLQIGQHNLQGKMNSQIINHFQQVVHLFIALVNSVVRPDDEDSRNRIEHIGLKWEGKFSRRIQLWLPYIISRLTETIDAMTEIDNTVLEQLHELILNTKAICTVKLIKLSAQLVKSLKMMCDPNLLCTSNGLTYSIFVDYYERVASNIAIILENCFKSPSNKLNIFYSDWREKIDEAISALLTSVETPLNMLYDEEANSECSSYEFRYASSVQSFKNTWELRFIVALSSLKFAKDQLEDSLKLHFIEFGMKGDENFDFVASELNNKYDILQQKFLSKINAHFEVLVEKALLNKNKKVTLKSLEFGLFDIFSYFCLNIGQMKSINKPIQQDICKQFYALFSSIISNSEKLQNASANNVLVSQSLLVLSTLVLKLDPESDLKYLAEQILNTLNDKEKQQANGLISKIEKSIIFTSLLSI